MARYERARALAALGRDLDAASEYQRALRAFPAHAFETRPFGAVIGTMQAQLARDPGWAWLSIEHLIRAGRLDEARATLERTRELSPAQLPPDVTEQSAWLSAAHAGEPRGDR